jgi:protein TonB
MAIVLFVPPVKEKQKGDEFITNLVSPEEMFRQKPVLIPGPRLRPSPEKPVPAPRRTKPEAASKNKGITTTGKDTPSSIRVPSVPTQPGEGGKTPVPPRKPAVPELPLREKLFDQGIIGDLAMKESAKKEEKEKKDKTFTFDASEYKFLIYNRKLKERIESIWIYPPDAAAGGIYGDLVLRFTIKKNGQLGAIELVRTSGHKNLDDAAMRALKEGAPYWPLPNEWGMDAYTIEGHFIYTIYGYYVR